MHSCQMKVVELGDHILMQEGLQQHEYFNRCIIVSDLTWSRMYGPRYLHWINAGVDPITRQRAHPGINYAGGYYRTIWNMEFSSRAVTI